jgi:hypothetical protein
VSGTFEITDMQGEALGILVDLIGLSGVHKRPEQGDCIVLDLLPGAHMMLGLGEMGQPFCVKVYPDGRMERISDEEAGITERPDFPSFAG